ncbi:MAG: SDR family oxidoreductase [Deltaproteobacteria bacterium]|nr:MAG: SDR family oxidoreductase [Deltaproteobacteria bacterium]
MSKIVLVTGCRSGFGLHIARDAAKAGHTVYAGLRDPATGAELAAETQGLDVTPLALDVTDAAQREAAVARILADHGRLDALVNNAGVAVGGPLEMIDEDELRRVFEVNVFGLWALTRACLPAMRAAGRGRVINISSMSGRQALPLLGVYASSKFAVEGMSEAWRHELRPLGIDVVLVEPGAYRTDIFGRNRTVARRSLDEPAYVPLVERIDALFSSTVDRTARDPREVSRLVTRLLTARAPKLRYALGPGTAVRNAALRLLPGRAIEAIIGRAVRPRREPTGRG